MYRGNSFLSLIHLDTREERAAPYAAQKNRLLGFSQFSNATLEHFEWHEDMICSVLIIQPKYRKIMH